MHKYDKALILGAGRSGRAAEALLRGEGATVLTICQEQTPDYNFEELHFDPEVVIMSPGFSLDHPWVKDLTARGIPLLSELELGWSRRHCPVIAVTGSNGKSTVVKWIADALTQAGQVAVPCGNYGLPLSAAVMLPEVPDWLVVEVSSFQLETVQEFHPQIGVLLNVLPNHLDRHGDLETYRALKLRLFEKMHESGTAIVPFGFFKTADSTQFLRRKARCPDAVGFQGLEKIDEKVPSIGKPTPACGHPSEGGDFIRGKPTPACGHPSGGGDFIRGKPTPACGHPSEGGDFIRGHSRSFAVKPLTFGTEEGADYRFFNGKVGAVDLSGTYFDNEVLGAAAAAVVAVGEACGLSPSVLESSARSFEPLPHRMQTVAEIGGVRFVDDSKATNLAAMCAALRMSGGRVHLIAGGRAKESNFSFAKDLLAQQVSRLYLIGEASTAMRSAWKDCVECIPCQTLEQAVLNAWERAEPGDTVLLSPACTSFDQFCSFAERGDVFVREVNRLAVGGAKA